MCDKDKKSFVKKIKKINKKDLEKTKATVIVTKEAK